MQKNPTAARDFSRRPSAKASRIARKAARTAKRFYQSQALSAAETA